MPVVEQTQIEMDFSNLKLTTMDTNIIRLEVLGSGDGMANGSTTLHYSSPILRLIYDTYMSSNSFNR